MTKNEFMEYLAFLSKLFSFEAPTDKEILATWYKPLENTNLAIAKDMAQMYFKEEQGRFKLSKLLEYKTAAMAGKVYREPKSKGCKLCKDTGYVGIERQFGTRIYEMQARCTCIEGDRLPKYIKQVDVMEMETRYRDWRGVFRLERVEDPVAPDNITEAINKFIGG